MCTNYRTSEHDLKTECRNQILYRKPFVEIYHVSRMSFTRLIHDSSVEEILLVSLKDKNLTVLNQT